MTTLSVWRFGTAEGAAQAEQTALDLQTRGLLTLIDGAVVSWPADKRKPSTTQLRKMAVPVHWAEHSGECCSG